MELEPLAFFSYARQDDEHDNGRLSEFCRRLAGEVSAQAGCKFEIFQDRHAIRWGQQWQQRVEESLGAATFLISIVTPRFLSSKECRKEFERFLERERRLGRSDLILPVYYIESSILSDEERRQADPVAKEVAARQFVDWRELRFEPFTDPQVGKTLARMAQQIVVALERDRSPAKPAPEEAEGPARQVFWAAESEPAESVVGETAPVRKNEPPAYIVDAMGRGDYRTITAALEVAQPGDRILVRSGTYPESLVIDKPIEIIGDGNRDDIVIEGVEGSAITFQTTMGRVANLTLRQIGEGKYCVSITQGRLDLEWCDITSQALSCVAIGNGADPRLRRNRIHDGKTRGVFVFNSARGTLEDNEIFANTLAGVQITTDSNPTLRRNLIYDGKRTGVSISENGRGMLEDNEIFANAGTGVAIKEGGNPTLRRNRIHNGRFPGVSVYENGLGTLEDNEIFANAGPQVDISKGGNPVLRRNSIHDGKRNGISVVKNGLGVLEDNRIIANAPVGVEIREGGNPTMRRNRIAENANQAVWIHDGGQGKFQDNDLRGNAGGAWDIAEDCKDKVIRRNNQE